MKLFRRIGLLAAALLLSGTHAEIREFELDLDPTAQTIHYTEGMLVAPGYISLERLNFTAVSDAGVNNNDDKIAFDGHDDVFPDDDGEMDRDDAFYESSSSSEGENDGPPRQLQSTAQEQDRRKLEGGMEVDSSAVDIAIFLLPHSCAGTRSGCDWQELGVGARTADDDVRWCCDNDAISLGLCDTSAGDEYGRLILKADRFDLNSDTNFHRFVEISSTGTVNKKVRRPKLEFTETGVYVVLFANCNIEGRQIRVKGETVWMSDHGYLPGELFEFMYFYILLTVVYLCLFLWYGCLMKLNKDSRIPIEKWILMTILIGFIEFLFRSLDYMLWNVGGYRQNVLIYLGILLGVMKRGISRVLIVMVSMGWGVVRDDLGPALRWLIILGSTYIGVSAVRDLMIVFAVEDMETLSIEEEVELWDIATILTFVVAAIDVIFIMWILDALNATMEYLENMNQTRKLMRYLRLRCIFLFSILFAVIWAIFSLVDTYDEDGIVREEHEWIVDAATEINYLFVLVSVAILWRPNPSAKEYAYVMELPSMGGDGNELELTGNVPSAMDDDDDEEPSGKNGYHDDDHGHDHRFQIDDGEIS